MAIETQASRGSARLNSKFSAKDLGDWDLGIKEACDHLGLSAPKSPTAKAVLELSLERMLIELRDDLGEEREALSILFGNNDFLSQMAKKFPRGGEIHLCANSFPDGSVIAWLRSDKAKLGRMAAMALEAHSEGLGQRLMPKLSVANISRQGGLELEEASHLDKSQKMWGDLIEMEQMPPSSVAGLDTGHAIAKWLKGCSERYAFARQAGDEDEGVWKDGVVCQGDVSPKVFAEMGSAFEVWSDFRPESLLSRLSELTAEAAPATPKRAAPRPSGVVRKAAPSRG